MILQPVFSIFPCPPLPSGTCRTPGLSIPDVVFPPRSFVRQTTTTMASYYQEAGLRMDTYTVMSAQAGYCVLQKTIIFSVNCWHSPKEETSRTAVGCVHLYKVL